MFFIHMCVFTLNYQDKNKIVHEVAESIDRCASLEVGSFNQES